jgi:ribosomal protein S6--L-glutamate ligase
MKLAILSRGEQLYSTQRLLRTAVDRGHEVLLMDVTKFDIITAESGNKLLYDGADFGQLDGILPRIGNTITYQGAAVIRQFEGMKVFTTTSSEALLHSRDKLITLQYLSASGFPIPRSFYPTPNSKFEDLPKVFSTYPLIIKTLTSTHGEGVTLVKNYQELSELAWYYFRTGTRFMIQEFIKECKGEDIRIFIVNGKVVASMKRTAAPGDFRSNLHMGGSASTCILYHKTKEMAISAVNSLGLKVAGVDIIESKRGPLILEINASPGLEGIENITQEDVAGSIIDYIESNSISESIQQ